MSEELPSFEADQQQRCDTCLHTSACCRHPQSVQDFGDTPKAKNVSLPSASLVTRSMWGRVVCVVVVVYVTMMVSFLSLKLAATALRLLCCRLQLHRHVQQLTVDET